MNKQVPTLGRILVMVGFALSCFGLLLFLWLAFGGATPLQPKGYRFNASFGDATQLAKQADVRISGVTVGKVVGLEPDKRTGLSSATLQIDARYAPLPVDTKAMLRQKTLLGETYVELTPGTESGPKIPDNGTLRTAQVSTGVELDQILRTFDPKTRAAFRNWVQQQAESLNGNGQALSDAIGNLAPFAQDTTQVLQILNAQKAAVRQLARNTGTVFDALSQADGQLAGLVTNGNRVFATTARRNQELAATFRALPTFEKESELTLVRLSAFAHATDPLAKALLPAAQQLSPTLKATAGVAPDLQGVFRSVGPLVTASQKGLPATRKFVNELRPLLAAFDSPLAQLNPILDGANLYRSDITAFVANSTAATNYAPNGAAHMLRTLTEINPEGLSLYDHPLPTSRSDAYALPDAASTLRSGGLAQFDTRGCGTTFTFNVPAAPASTISPQLLQNLIHFGLTDGTVTSTACHQQPRYSVAGTLTRYPQVQPGITGLQAGLPQP